MQGLTAHAVVANTQTSKIVVHVSDTQTFVAVSQPTTTSGWGLVAAAPGAASDAVVRIHCCEFVAREMFSLRRYFTAEAARTVRQMAGRQKPAAPRRERFVFVALVERLRILGPGTQTSDAVRVVRQLSDAGIVHTDLNQAGNWGYDAQGQLRVIDFDDAYSLGADVQQALALNTENARKRLPTSGAHD